MKLPVQKICTSLGAKMPRKPRMTMDDLQRALSRARLPHLELGKLVGRGYFLKDTRANGKRSRISPHPLACTDLMTAREMLTYLTGLSDGAFRGKCEVFNELETYQQTLVEAACRIGLLGMDK